MTPDEIIEVLQGFKAGRGWQFLSTASEWKTPILSSLDSMLHALYSGQTIRLTPLPDEISIPARVIPAPLREAPIVGTPYYVVSLTDEKSLCFLSLWDDDDTDNQRLARGLVYLDEGSAIKAGKAMCPYA